MPKMTTIPVNGNEIRKLRTQRGWTIAELAQRVGVKGAHVSNTELERRSCSEALAHRIARELGVGISDILLPGGEV